MPDDFRQPSSRDQSYTEEMQRWMARQSFWYRLTHGRRHPDSRPLFISLLLLVGWLVPISASLFFGYFLMVQTYLGGKNFSRIISREAGKVLSIQNPSVIRAQWKSGTLTLNDLKGDGKPEGWVRQLAIGSVRFELPLKNMLRNVWSPDKMILQDVDLELRGGLLGSLEVERLNQENPLADADSLSGMGFPGITPDGNNFKINRLSARNISIRWGLDQRSSGQVKGSSLDATMKDGTWTLVFTGGELNTGWLKGAEIDEIILLTSPDNVVIKSLKFRLKSGEGSQIKDSVGIGEGVISVAPSPVIFLQVAFPSLNINHLLSKNYQRIFAGQASGKITFKGTTAKESGLTTEAALDFQPGFGFGAAAAETFPILEVLGGEAADIPLRHMEATRGSIRFTITDKILQSDGLVLEGANGERIEGTFSRDFSTNEITGALRVGVKPAMLAGHPLLAEKFFKEETPALRCLSIPLKGPLADSTTALAEAIRTALHEEIAAAKAQNRP